MTSADALAAMMADHPEVEIAFGHAGVLLRRSRDEGSSLVAYEAGIAFGRLVELVEGIEGEALDWQARSALREYVIEAAWPARVN